MLAVCPAQKRIGILVHAQEGATTTVEEIFQRLTVYARRRNEDSQAENGQHGQCEQYPVPEIRNPEDVRERFDHVR